MKIFLADLGHNILTVSSDVYPLGVANQATYLRSHINRDVELDISIFREPEVLKVALDAGQPDVLGLSNYSWNLQLSHHFAQYAKSSCKETLVCMGGPNWPLTADLKESFLQKAAAVDVYIDGPTYEGERAFVGLIQRFFDGGESRQAIFEEPIPGNTWLDPESGALVCGGFVDRISNLDDIPSPYLAGLLDPFFATGYFPLLQIARGCPFSCTFCNSGVSGNSRIHAHSVENVKADLIYVAERVKPELPLCLADDNFGMYARDEEIAEFIGWLQDEYNWPHYVRTTTGKNNGERIIRVMRKARGALPMTSAVQSLNPTVLENIKRSNIKLETYQKLQEELHRQGMQSYGELILCLPGETKASFMKSVKDLLDAGSERVSVHQLMLLDGAEMSTPESRARFGFETRYRVVARNIGNYTGTPVIEVEEMVVETPTFPFDDYLEARVFHLLLTIFYYEGNFGEAFALAKEAGIDAFDLVVRMQDQLDVAPQEFKQVIEDFVRESREELFSTRDECLAWASANYDALIDGSVGGNLLSKYSMIGRFITTKATLEFLEMVIGAEVGGADSSPRNSELSAVCSYLRSVLLHTPFAEELTHEVDWTTDYDIEAWVADKYEHPLSHYLLLEPKTFHGAASEAIKTEVTGKIATFGEHPSGLGKFTRTIFARDLRRTLTDISSSHQHN